MDLCVKMYNWLFLTIYLYFCLSTLTQLYTWNTSNHYILSFLFLIDYLDRWSKVLHACSEAQIKFVQYTCTMFKIYFQTGKTAQHYIGCHFVHSGCAVSEKRQLLLCTTVCNLPNDLQRRASAGPQQLSWKPRCTSTTLELVKRRHLAQLGRGLYPLYKIW